MNSLVLPGEPRWVDRNEIIFRRGQGAFGGETCSFVEPACFREKSVNGQMNSPNLRRAVVMVGRRLGFDTRLLQKIMRCCRKLTVESLVGFHLLRDRKSTRLNSSHLGISYAVFCLKKKKQK